MDNVIYINDELFKRFYYKGTKPTRYFASRSGKIYSEISSVIMKPSLNGHGYQTVGLRFYNKAKPKYFGVHVIVATTFHGYYKGLVVDHVDGNHLNNGADNLEWVTYSENTIRAYKNNQRKKYFGETNKSYKYADQLITQVCELLQQGYSRKEVRKITGVSKHTIDNLLNGSARVNITKKYHFPKELYQQIPNNPLSGETKCKIIEMRNQGIGFKEIQKDLNIISLSQVYHAYYDKKYKI